MHFQPQKRRSQALAFAVALASAGLCRSAAPFIAMPSGNAAQWEFRSALPGQGSRNPGETGKAPRWASRLRCSFSRRLGALGMSTPAGWALLIQHTGPRLVLPGACFSGGGM